MKTHLFQLGRAILFLAFLVLSAVGLKAQNSFEPVFSDKGLILKKIGEVEIPGNIPLISFQLNGEWQDVKDGKVSIFHDSLTELGLQKLNITLQTKQNFNLGYKGLITFKNISTDTLSLSNVLPFSPFHNEVYITGKGDHRLSRTHLFRPGFSPVNVIVPDNAWELGFSTMTQSSHHFCGLTRRTGKSEKAQRHRFETILPPGESVTYTLWIEPFVGDWHQALELMFRQRMLYDVEPGTFNNAMYERQDLKWIRKAYVSHLMMTWDENFYSPEKNYEPFLQFIERGKKWYGGDDFIGIWPTWPTLGLDLRNQWDLYEDLPGGLGQLQNLATKTRQKGTRFFISYNPWDTDTRNENHYSGMGRLIHQITADGVVLDTQGSSSRQLQNAADSAREGVIMYSEGMAVPRDMENIISGRVHNALYYPPMLNLNKFIKPDFAIFRVAEIKFERIRREYLLSLFNGYGTEINLFPPGRPEWIEEDYRLLGKTSRILREHSSNFNSTHFQVLVPTLSDSIWVNEWLTENNTIYTVFSLHPQGFDGPLFEKSIAPNEHIVDIWNHKEPESISLNNKTYIPAFTESFHKSNLGTNNEGAATVLAIFPKLLATQFLNGDQLSITAKEGDEIRIWKHEPDYENTPIKLSPGNNLINLTQKWHGYEGKIVIQLLKDGELIDETIHYLEPSTPGLISKIVSTKPTTKTPEGMVFVSGGSYKFTTNQGDNFIPYPKNSDDSVVVKSFFMDQFPVTNKQFNEFLKATAYIPQDTNRFLKHWTEGKIPPGQENFPVVYVSYEDAQAYANWAGKRLPTECEWQFAAQNGDDTKLWPWDIQQVKPMSTESITSTLTVAIFSVSDSLLCNPGNGIPQAVGSYPNGANPLGINDLTGCVWQLTNDIYYNGTYQFIMMKGGSYFNPGSSWWYVQGGPRPLNWNQMLLRVSQGFERNATMGFRCVAD